MFSLGDRLRLLYTTAAGAFLLYLLAGDAFFRLLWFLALYAAIDLMITFFVRSRQRRRSEEAVRNYLREPDEQNGKNVLRTVRIDTAPVFEHMSRALAESATEIQRLKAEATAERLLLERWAHDVKTPLALFLLLLENEKDGMDPGIYQELHRLRQEIEMQVMQLLYYGKMDAEHPDERFETIRLSDLVESVLEDLRYEALLRNIRFDAKIRGGSAEEEILTDPRLLRLILTQILNNALKYAPAGTGVEIVRDGLRLSVRNDGEGVRAEELPFLFDRAFSGVHPNRAASTGLGLYLANFYAGRLGIRLTVDPVSAEGRGFLIHLDFPALYRPPGKGERNASRLS